ncbi:MAG: cupredoxin domain-containing protein [Gaiellaceae bacterium]
MRRLALLVAFAAVLLPACGEENTPDGASPDGAGAGGGEVVEVSLSEFALTPASFSLEPGSYTFHVVNDGSVVHALEVEGPLGEVKTADLAPGESADLNVDLSEPGDYEMYCPVDGHKDEGMEGTITVGGGGGGATTTDETTTEEDSGYRY